MARYIGPKRRLSRREGVALTSKDLRLIERKGAVPPGQHGKSLRRRLSEYRVQLREKQKLKRIYGIMERQMRRYFKEASKRKSSKGLALLELLETRLDNVVYRLGFSHSRAGARQLVTHGHITVDERHVNIPSFKVGIDHTVALSTKLGNNVQVRRALQDLKTLPPWLKRKATVGKVLRLPQRSEMEQIIDEHLVVEYYSR